jgi:uncharacterized protein DUF998
LIGAFGLGLVIAGLFVTDPGMGYPPGAPLKGEPETLHGWIHGLNAIPTFSALATACFVIARRFAAEPGGRGWASYSRLVGALILLLFFLGNVSAPLNENGVLPSPTGIIQRAQIIVGWTWLALTALRLLRQQREAMVGTPATPANLAAATATQSV